MNTRPLAEQAPLVARTVPLDAPVDLLAVAGDDGVVWAGPRIALAGRGCALAVELPGGLDGPDPAARVAAALAAIEVDDDVRRPGSGPVAVGALPFDRRAPATLVVPELVVGRTEDGQAWMTTVGRGTAPRLPLDAVEANGHRLSPRSFTLTALRSHEDWCATVEAAVAEIRAGRFTKVVLGREVLVEADRPVPRTEVLARLRSLYPSCTLFGVGPFVGASPELLVSRLGDQVRCHPLAGTIPRSGDPDADARAAAALMASAKDREEHHMVVEAIVERLAPVCAALDVPAEPSILALRNVSHLGTLIRGRLAAPPPSVLELVERLHPTPAVGGQPTEAALAWLAGAEGLDRGPWAGPVGWVDARGDGVWVVGIRSAVLDGTRARLLAGVGVVADSDPVAELAETQFKLQALLAALVRP